MLAKMNKWSAWVSETRADVLHSYYRELLKLCGFKILEECAHAFSPQGYTAMFLLSESHFAVHTFPERGRSYVELSSCVDGPFQVFLEKHDLKTVDGDDQG